MNRSSELKRKTPMNRTGFAREVRIETRDVARVELAPAAASKPKKIKPRKCANRACRAEYMPDPVQPFKNWCSLDCGTVLALARLAKKKEAEAKAQRAEEKRQKEQNQSVKKLLKRAEKLVNEYVRLRDKDDGCISCHMPSHYDGIWTASHFKSVGSNSALRFNTWNIHKGCEQCNLFKSGNIAEYEKRLVLKIGAERVEWLKNHERVRKYDAEYLQRMCKIMRKKIRRLTAKDKRMKATPRRVTHA